MNGGQTFHTTHGSENLFQREGSAVGLGHSLAGSRPSSSPQQSGIPRAYDSYDKLLDDPAIIATSCYVPNMAREIIGH